MSDFIMSMVLFLAGIILGFLVGYGLGYDKGIQPECDKLGGEIINSQCVKVLI